MKTGEMMFKRIKKIAKIAFVSLSLLVAKKAAKKIVKKIIKR